MVGDNPPESRRAVPGGYFRLPSISGRWAERYVEWRLRCRGWRIEARNLRTPVGEIDLLAREGQILVIVEVKYRSNKGIGHSIFGKRRGFDEPLCGWQRTGAWRQHRPPRNAVS